MDIKDTRMHMWIGRVWLRTHEPSGLLRDGKLTSRAAVSFLRTLLGGVSDLKKLS
jgi:hypothetical protein